MVVGFMDAVPHSRPFIMHRQYNLYLFICSVPCQPEMTVKALQLALANKHLLTN